VKYTSRKEEVPGLMKKFAPRLVLVDILQKEVIEQIKNDHKTSKVPVILMTGYTLRQQPLEIPLKIL
jgi:CheY-like chemotaxis protein